MPAVIGTSGYSYEDWRGIFYPENLPKGKMLDFYVQHFKAVEINSSYYAVPHPAVFYQMSQKTPADFEFVVKVHQTTTHERPKNDPALIKLLEAIKPLQEAGKFAGFLAQFPYSFKNSGESRDYLKSVQEKIESLPVFVEFRNWTWDRPETYQFLQENKILYVNVDEPRLKGLLQPQEIVTGKLGYVRFHGRNSKDWWEGNNQTRYNYLYSKPELDEWLIGLSRILKKTFKTYIFFNNHPQGKAIQNAKMLKEIIESYLAD
jgi:uncharacterized protein YecE (DUF72 family)